MTNALILAILLIFSSCESSDHIITVNKKREIEILDFNFSNISIHNINVNGKVIDMISIDSEGNVTANKSKSILLNIKERDVTVNEFMRMLHLQGI